MWVFITLSNSLFIVISITFSITLFIVISIAFSITPLLPSFLLSL